MDLMGKELRHHPSKYHMLSVQYLLDHARSANKIALSVIIFTIARTPRLCYSEDLSKDVQFSIVKGIIRIRITGCQLGPKGRE